MLTIERNSWSLHFTWLQTAVICCLQHTSLNIERIAKVMKVRGKWLYHNTELRATVPSFQSAPASWTWTWGCGSPFQHKLEYPTSSGLRKFYKDSLLCPYANLLDHTVLQHCWSYQHTSDWPYQDIVRESFSAAFQQEKGLLMNTLAQLRKQRPK